ncbi:MAG TPA: lytic transglycosylase domain-containing protein, partial [Acidimicrobiales bacterium]|nr:lytic transglycosylase domain-containing protein [Acidimicrobiales bacterium]
HPELEAEALDLLPEAVRTRAEAHLAAGKDLTALNGPVDPARPLPRWRIVPPEPAATLLAHYRDAEANTGVPWEYLASIHLVETRMGRIRGDSSAGARGPMQFIPSTWDMYGEGGDIESTHDSIRAAARKLRADGARTDMARALFAYNNSSRYVRAITVYAQQMEAEDRTFLAYHGWQVYYGSLLLPEGTVIP